MVGLPGATEGRLETISHKFKLRLSCLSKCFPLAVFVCLGTGTE